MVLLVAGIALTALLLASYTTRYTWIECGSLALSMAALIGIVFLSTAKGEPVALAEVAEGELRPFRVFNLGSSTA